MNSSNNYSNDTYYIDKYEQYEQLYDPDWESGDVHRKTPSHKPKKSESEILAELADERIGLEGGLEISYQPSEYEAGWLIDSLRTFFDLEYITDITGQVKGGKEASVYRCTGHEITGETLLAAKVYRPRQFRNLRNDKTYREGRSVLKSNGRAAKATDHRMIRALNRKSAYGVQVAHTSWLMYEFTTMEMLYNSGAAVPKPFKASDNAILMSYIGDAQRAAPTLHEVSLTRGEALPLFDDVFQNMELMLQHGLIHGDLSAYNILYWDGEITFIDFPQVADIEKNSNARFLLKRDIQRICDYFALQGVGSNPHRIFETLWERYNPKDVDDLLADLSMLQEDE